LPQPATHHAFSMHVPPTVLPPTPITSLAPPTVPLAAASSRPARPASAGGNHPRLSGLCSLSRGESEANGAADASDVHRGGDGSAHSGGGSELPPLDLGKLGGCGGGGLPLPSGGKGGGGLTRINLAGLSTTYDREDDDGRMSQAEKLRIFAKKCSQITPDLYLGADEVARDLSKLQAHGITHVLNTAGVACANYHKGTSDLEYRTVHLYDSPRQDISCVLYMCVEWIDASIEGGVKVFVHCHQGVSRSSTMVIAYMMWKRGLSFNDAFRQVKAARAVANPNAGFIVKLISFDKALRADSPPDPPRLYRMAPEVGGPVGRQVDSAESAPLTTADFDARTSWVVYGLAGVCVWHGERTQPEYVAAARAWCRQLERFERAPPSVEMQQGEESDVFWSMVERVGLMAGRLPTYDGDYGVGKTPSVTPTETVLSLPQAPPLPGVYTTATEETPLHSARGRPPPPEPTAAALGLRKLGEPADLPPPTPRGRPNVLLPTARPPPAPDDGEAARSSKKAREEGDGGSDGAQRRGEPFSELYSYPGWENLSLFDCDDLLEEGIFALLTYQEDHKTPKRVMLWVGGESEASGERDADIMEIAEEFLQAKELGQLPAVIVHQGEEDEAEGFWDFFIN